MIRQELNTLANEGTNEVDIDNKYYRIITFVGAARYLLGNSSVEEADVKSLVESIMKKDCSGVLKELTGVLKELNSCFKNFKTFICETLEDQTSHHEPVINTFLEFAYQWSWFYLNLSCLSKAFSIEVLHKELSMDFHLTVLYQMVGLISQIMARQ